MSSLVTRVNFCLRTPSCSSRCTAVYGKQLATWADRLKRWRSSPKSEKEPTATESSTTADDTIDNSSGNGVDDPSSKLVKEKEEMIAKQKAELEELNVSLT